MMLDKLIPKNKELEEQEYPEEFEPSKKIKTDDPDIKDFLEKKQKKEEKKDGKKDSAQDDLPQEEEQGVGSVPGEVEESEKKEEELITEPQSEESIIDNPDQQPSEQGITFTKSFNIPVNEKNMGTAKKILDDNIKNGFVIAFQAGTYVDKKNIESIKKALKYFVDNDYKVIIATENVQEIDDGTK